MQRAARHFDAYGRLLRWPARHSLQQLSLWVLWAGFPPRCSLAEAQVKTLLNRQHAFADDARRQVARDACRDLDALALRARRQQLGNALDQRPDLDLFRDEVELADLDLGEIEDFVDQREQRLARCLDGADIAVLFRIDARAGQQLGHAEHAVQRRADFVADGGEEAGLGLDGLLPPA